MHSALSGVKDFLVKSNQIVLKNYVTSVRKISTSCPSLKYRKLNGYYEKPVRIGYPPLPYHPPRQYYRRNEFRFLQFPVTREDEDAQYEIEKEREKKIKIKQNKSGLNQYHYRVEHNMMPDLTEDELETMPLQKYRNYFGMFGNSSNIDVKALWPSTSELEDIKEKEKVEFPYTVQEMIAMAKEKRYKEEEAIWQRQEELKENMKKLDKWRKELKTRVEKREGEAKRLMEIKEKQIADVREILGYNISPHDPKFQEVLEKKIEEDKRIAKKERKLKKKQMELDRLQEKAQQEAMEAEASHLKSKGIEGEASHSKPKAIDDNENK